MRDYYKIRDILNHYVKNNDLTINDVLSKGVFKIGNSVISGAYYFDTWVIEGSLRYEFRDGVAIYSSLFDSSLELLSEINPKPSKNYKLGGTTIDKSIVDISKALYKIYTKSLREKYFVGHLHMNGDDLQFDVMSLCGSHKSEIISSVVVGEYNDLVLTKVSNLCKALVDAFGRYKEPIKEVYFVFDDPEKDGVESGRVATKLHSDGEVSVTVY